MSIDSPSIPSCFGPHGIVGVSFGMPRDGELSSIGHRGDYAIDYATRTSVKMRMTAGGAEGRSSRPTWLPRCRRIMW